MFGDGALTLREFAMKEPLPLAKVHDAVLDFLRNRDDTVLFGAQAVNAYVDEPRMTQDVDILSTRAADLAEELRSRLAAEFHIPVRVRTVAGEKGSVSTNCGNQKIGILPTFDRSTSCHQRSSSPTFAFRCPKS